MHHYLRVFICVYLSSAFITYGWQGPPDTPRGYIDIIRVFYDGAPLAVYQKGRESTIDDEYLKLTKINILILRSLRLRIEDISLKLKSKGKDFESKYPSELAQLNKVVEYFEKNKLIAETCDAKPTKDNAVQINKSIANIMAALWPMIEKQTPQ